MSGKIKKTSIGGQAVIEGIMMRGPNKTATVIRTPDGLMNTKLEDTINPAKGNTIFGIPFIRGSVNMVISLIIGYKALNYSASFFTDEFGEEELSGFEKWLKAKTGERFSDVIMGFSIILGVLLAVGLFIVLPTFITGFMTTFIHHDVARALMEGCIRIAIFLAYIYGVTFMEDIKRVFSYHGAEHKTIACYEHGEELIVENVRKHTRFHPRCGTSFLLIVMVVSILVFSLLSWDNIWQRMILRIVLLPVVIGISYEIIRIAGKYENIITKLVSAPGLWLQRLTTKEPDDSMIEVAIEALKRVIPENKEEDEWK